MAGSFAPAEGLKVMNEDWSDAKMTGSNGDAEQLPPWAECEVFCIHSYAGEEGLPCGWRGKLAEAKSEAPARARRICPRCGRTTLLSI